MYRQRGTFWALTFCLGLSLGPGCTDDPQDPKTWIKKLDDVRERREAVRQLAKLKDESAYEALAKLYERTRDPEHLDAIKALRTDKAVPLFAEQLDYSDDNFEAASHAATGLYDIATRDDKGREAAKAAVDALHKAVLKKLPIKTRANVVKVESMKALAAIRDPRSVEVLTQVLETSADEQDFFLNKTAAKCLAAFGDKRAVPALVRGLFMTGRGADIFSECRLALVSIGGDETVDALVQAMQRRNEKLEADAKKYEFYPGIIVQKTSIVLGDLRNPRAIAPLTAELSRPDEGMAPACQSGQKQCVSGHQSVLLALGLIGDRSASRTLLGVAADVKHPPKLRAAAASALNLLGDTAALPALLAMARTPYYDPKKQSIDNTGDRPLLAATGVTEYSRLLDSPEGIEPLIGLYKAAPAGTDVQVAFKNALARGAVLKECGKDIACYGKRLAVADPDNTVASAKSEKAAFQLGRLGHAAVAELQKHVGHRDPATREAVLLALTRVAGKDDAGVQKAIADQLAIDETKPMLMPLVSQMRVTSAILAHK